MEKGSHLTKPRVFRPIACATCGVAFVPRSSGNRFCSERCVEWSRAFFDCETCGDEFRPTAHQRRNGGGRFCSIKCAAQVRANPSYESAVARFFTFYDRTDGCWLWKGSTAKEGYGAFGLGGRDGNTSRVIGAHVFSFELHVGPVPDGYDVCHHCDVRACVRPGHLFVGTRKDNMQDASRKGRLHGSQRRAC